MYLLRHRRGGGRHPLPRQSSLSAAPRAPPLSELPRSPSLPCRLSGAEPPRRALSEAEESQRFDDYMRSLKWALAALVLVCVMAGVYSLSGNQRLRASIGRLWSGTG